MMFGPVMSRFRAPRRPPFNDPDDANPSSSEPAQDTASDIFYPGLFDVFKVRYILRWKIISEGLPVEIVDMIMEAAEYWPSIEARMDTRTIIRQDHDRELLRTAPLCYDEKTLQSASPHVLPHRTIHPCRKIVFRISSHDQGWGGGPRGESPYDGSYTWFDVEIIHAIPQKGSNQTDSQASAEPSGQAGSQEPIGPQHSHFLPGPRKLQMNKTAVKQTQEYTITWHYRDNIQAESADAEEIERSQGRGRATLDGNIVRALSVGDSIAVWGRARFPGWSNHIEFISVRIFWAV
ncbi:hypothetical protein CNMCM6106_008904 [Aspergillus hiratsukae]|uniref:Uncharacterized protein n=2 Tax=Aspergillus hiratsukae TaxID=1194566 RepID=A0A8H6PXB9_9EURO|nr:hypothetical protein CNMCM6106_008904 [Aspergillus hiratsukae]